MFSKFCFSTISVKDNYKLRTCVDSVDRSNMSTPISHEGLYLIAHALILKVTKRHYTFLIPFLLFNPAVGRMHGDEVCLLVTVQDCKKNCHMMVKPTNYMQHRNKGATLFRCRTSGLQGGFFSQFILSNLP